MRILLRVAFILVLSANLGVSVAATVTEAPFWRRPKVFKRITDERAIVVAVRDEALPPKRVLKITGAGLVASPIEWTFREAQNYEKLKSISDYIKESRWDAGRQQVFLHMAAFNYHARMWMKIRPFEADDGQKFLDFEVVEGNFLGMKGQIGFQTHNTSRSIMWLDANYQFTKLPFPVFFVEFGLEFVAQRVAGLMREHLEREYQKTRAK